MKVGQIFFLFLLLTAQIFGQSPDPNQIIANGVELHYVELGKGEALIFIHGGSGDYRSWESQLELFSPNYRVISYSRRYNYPNQNPTGVKNHSAYIEADDLAALIHQLKLGRAHLVGSSYGAFAALVLALRHPDMVRSLVLAEPPVHQLIRDTPEGEAAYQDFMTNVMRAAGEAFKRGDDKAAMKILSDGISGPERWERLTPQGLAAVMQNARFFNVLTQSSDPFPKLSKDKIRQLRVPTLIITGENTTRIHKLVTEELARLIPNAESVVIPNAGHASNRDNPPAFNQAVLKFLSRQPH